MSEPLFIANARIVDGTGAPWFRGDVLIENGRIAAVGPRLPRTGAPVLDAADRWLAPGFIDAHCHDDLITLRRRGRDEKIHQGVTTVVVGNCSFSLYPVDPASRPLLAEHFGTLLGTTDADAEIFADLDGYARAIDGEGAALNVVSLVGHAAIRLAVLGFEQRPATADERRRMQDLLAAQLRQGAAASRSASSTRRAPMPTATS